MSACPEGDTKWLAEDRKMCAVSNKNRGRFSNIKNMVVNPSFSRDEYIKKKRKARFVRWGIVSALLIVIFGTSIYIVHRPEIRIDTVVFSGGVLVKHADVEAETLVFLGRSYLGIIPKNNILFYPHDSLEAYLKDVFRRIDQISITRSNMHSLSVAITERKPVALWCDTLPEVGPSLHCYFMDNLGVLFAEAPQFSGDAYTKYFGLINSDTPLGSQFTISSTTFRLINDFVHEVDILSLSPEYIVAKDDGEFSIYLSNGGYILFDLKSDIGKTRDNLEALLRAPAFATSTRERLPIDYIDLRFGNKLFYKLR